MEIVIDGFNVSRCWEFARQVAPNQKPNKFDNKEMAARKMEKIVTDTFVGKLGELAVQKWMAACGVQIELDWSVTPRGEWDVADISYNGWSIDVKCTKSRGHYFLIDWGKLQFRTDAGELPQFFLMTRLKNDLAGIAKDGSQNCVVELAGYIDTRELNENNSKVKSVRRGEELPDTGVKEMATSNFAVLIKDLEKDWDKLATTMKRDTPFALDSFVPPGDVEEVVQEDVQEEDLKLDMKYSLLIAGKDIERYDSATIEEFIKRGIKCLVFVERNQLEKFSLLEKYGRSFFQLYGVVKGNLPTLTIYDGKRNEQQNKAFKELCQLTLTNKFNDKQYDVEHFNTEQVLIVKASAGTGKTTVMIDRIMFLLATVENLRPADIAMTTFTNMATANMIKKLQQRALEMYNLTQKQKWYEVMEEFSQMQISTIDSFFYTILKNDGSVLGYGTNSAIKSFVYERKLILREIINDFFKASNNNGFLDEYVMPIYEYVDKAYEIWNNLHSRGYFEDEINRMDFGTAADRQDNTINQTLQAIIIEAEKRYQEFKKKKNAYSMGDIKVDMDALARCGDFDMRQNKFRFMFIDEFQDTDNSQIRSAVWLHKIMGCQLFVVGDVKQSIYRFRGAEESAFKELGDRLKENGVDVHETELEKNYRTATGVMNSFNKLFAQWGGDDLIKWNGSAEPCVKGNGNLHLIVSKNKDVEAIKLLKEWMGKSKHICVLTRTNNEVVEIAARCREESIPCRAKLKGGFYSSAPVRDMYALLGAMLYPKDTRRLYNLLLTPYTTSVPDGEKLARMHGDEDEVRAYLEELLSKDRWNDVLHRQRVEPFFPMLNKLIDKMQLLARYEFMRHDNFPLYKYSADATYDVDFYEENLNKLLNILYESFTGENVSLSGVFSFLGNKMQTDREEDCVYPDNKVQKGKCLIEAMTVHKAKGAEFETVILPYTNNEFFKIEDSNKFTSLITDMTSGRLNVGWKFKQNKIVRKNNYYESMTDDEHQAVRREEARLLYVAMTRVKKNLIIITADEIKDDTWGEYLLECEEVR